MDESEGVYVGAADRCTMAFLRAFEVVGSNFAATVGLVTVLSSYVAGWAVVGDSKMFTHTHRLLHPPTSTATHPHQQSLE